MVGSSYWNGLLTQWLEPLNPGFFKNTSHAALGAVSVILGSSYRDIPGANSQDLEPLSFTQNHVRTLFTPLALGFLISHTMQG